MGGVGELTPCKPIITNVLYIWLQHSKNLCFFTQHHDIIIKSVGCFGLLVRKSIPINKSGLVSTKQIILCYYLSLLNIEIGWYEDGKLVSMSSMLMFNITDANANNHMLKHTAHIIPLHKAFEVLLICLERLRRFHINILT